MRTSTAQTTTAISKTTATPVRPNPRPLVLSADKRQISYTSKSGKVLTLELTNSTTKATDREIQIKTSKPFAEVKFTDHKASKTSPSEQSKVTVAESWIDTVSFWISETIEVACFGPYDEPPAIKAK